MRVLHVYGGNRFGGVERVLLSLAEHQALAPDLEQEFALCYEGRLSQELRRTGARVHRLGGVRSSRPWQVGAARERLSALLAGGTFATALCHAWWPLAVFAPAVRRRGLRLGLFQHNLVHGRHWLQYWAGRHRPDYALAPGLFMGATLARMYPGIQARTWAPPVPPPVRLDATARRRMRASLSTEEGAAVILVASRFEPWKGHRLLLASLARLAGDPAWTVWIAGGADSPREERYLAELQSEARRLGLEKRLRWLGPRSDVEPLMGAADLYCQPNTGPEPYGMVFAEAMAAGLPVVTTRGGGPDDFLPPECGDLCAPKPGAIAAALRRLLDDPPRRRAMGAAGRERARAQFNPATQMRALPGLLSV